MDSASLKFFETLRDHSDLVQLIAEGETEGLYLECKAPSTPQLNKELRATLAKAISGFANSSGGVLVWGISTTKHHHGSLDVLTQIEPLGNCANFMRQLTRAAITATSPRVEGVQCRVIREKPTDTRGVVLTYIPPTGGDPIRSNEDEHFYVRNGDEFSVAAYELIKRLFAAAESPDLSVAFKQELVKAEADGTWKIPLSITNRSSAVAADVMISVLVENPDSCESAKVPGFKDASSVNPGQHIFILDNPGRVHRGMDHLVGYLHVKMKLQKKFKRALKVKVSLFANQMRARAVSATISLARKGFSVTRVAEKFLY